MYGVNIHLVCIKSKLGTVTMYFKTSILTILFLKIMQNGMYKKNKKQPKFSKILDRSEKGKQTFFF